LNNVYVKDDGSKNIFITGYFLDKYTNKHALYVARYNIDYQMTHWVRYFNLTSNLIPKSLKIAEEL